MIDNAKQDLPTLDELRIMTSDVRNQLSRILSVLDDVIEMIAQAETDTDILSRRRKRHATTQPLKMRR